MCRLQALSIGPTGAVHEMDQDNGEVGLGSRFISSQGPMGFGYLEPPLVAGGRIDVDIASVPKGPIPVWRINSKRIEHHIGLSLHAFPARAVALNGLS